MQSVFVIITKLIASKNYFCKEVFCNNFDRDGIPSVFSNFLMSFLVIFCSEGKVVNVLNDPGDLQK